MCQQVRYRRPIVSGSTRRGFLPHDILTAASFFLIAAILVYSVDHIEKTLSTMSDLQSHLESPPPYAAVDDDDDDEQGNIQSQDANSACRLFLKSLRRYKALLLALEEQPLRSASIGIMLVPEVKEDLSRLRIWGEQTHAVFPQNSRRSLDERLRGDEGTKEIVLRFLRRLNDYIGKGCVKIHIATPNCY